MVGFAASMSESGVALGESVAFAEVIRALVISCQHVLASIVGSNASDRSFSAGDRLNSNRQTRICEKIMSGYAVALVEWDNVRVNRADLKVLV